MAKRATASDTIAVMFPYDRIRGRRNNVHPGKTFAANPADDTAFDQKHKWYAMESMTFSGAVGMHAALVGIAEARQAFVTRGQPALDGVACCRRLKNPKDGDPASLKDADLHMLAIDADKWPNIGGFDPRTQSEEAWRWMLSVLGPEFANTTVSAFWSSSCCVRTAYEPATL